ncbi:phosphotriesterase-related protein [Psychromicrobium silvestre]|uniref:Phosphotriesterase-related protein n=1 Tax=Psychromicrobium silvestre TaxID=1645614 RepID=A0A7Y9LR82_9MICC|nr:phosphotriesterase [Psychromicrobium silvestre]NYE94110.1 phosphotriesterase-related protein [Psychromicrobium silvestre]
MSDVKEPTARTILGDLPSSRLGLANSHDHVFFASPLLPQQELDDELLGEQELAAFTAAGGQSVVQWTPAGLGRRRTALARLSRRTGVHILSATGRHRAVHYPEDARYQTEDALTARFLADLKAKSLPCGLIKIGTGFHHLDDFERLSLHAAAHAQLATGAPIAVHLELGTAGQLVLAELAQLGVPAEGIVLGHLGRNPDSGYLTELAQSGAWLCFDGPSRTNHATDWRLFSVLEELASAGHLPQLLLGGDTTTAAARSVTSGPGMPALLSVTGQRIARLLGTEAWQKISVGNPSRAFALRNR